MPPKKRKQITKQAQPAPEIQSKFIEPVYACSCCGAVYTKQRGVFPSSRSPLYRGTGYIPVCNTCIDRMYNEYFALYRDDKLAIRRMCMKFDLYWSDILYDASVKQQMSTSQGVSLMRVYITKTNLNTYINKTYDDTIKNECGEDFLDLEELNGKFINAMSGKSEPKEVKNEAQDVAIPDDEVVESLPLPEITQDEIEFWGPGYTKSMYAELEQRKTYWISKLGDDLDVGAMALLRQICNLEIDINKDRAAGKPVDKSINTLNTLIGSASLKPSQRKEELDASTENTTFGEWIKKWEEKRPVPEPDEELNDTDNLIKTITVWFFGHLCKMLSIKNSYSKMYEEEIERLRVEFPEFSDEDDDSMLSDIFGSGGEPDD